jgi:CRP-like cAMP-binding protein
MNELTPQTLRRVELLRDLDERELSTLCTVLMREPLRPAGTVICAEGEQGRCCYLLLSGTVDVVKRMPNGTSHVIATIRQHQFFGEVALIDSAPRSASCVAHDGCEVARFERAEFDRLMQGGSVFAVRFASSIATSLAGQLRNAHRRLGMSLLALNRATVSSRTVESRGYFLGLEAQGEGSSRAGD